MNFETLTTLSNGELAARVNHTSIANELCTYQQFELLNELRRRQYRRAVKRADLQKAIGIMENEIGEYAGANGAICL